MKNEHVTKYYGKTENDKNKIAAILVEVIKSGKESEMK